jgi:hypothetical protein
MIGGADKAEVKFSKVSALLSTQADDEHHLIFYYTFKIVSCLQSLPTNNEPCFQNALIEFFRLLNSQPHSL